MKNELETLRRDGILMLPGWFAGERLAALRAEVESLESDPPRWARTPARASASYGTMVHFSPLAARRSHDTGRVTEIARAFNGPNFRGLCDAYLGRDWAFDRILLGRDHARDAAITPWHVDHFPFAERCLKFFIYLNDTDASTGAFSYVPGWHELVYSLSLELPDFRARQQSFHVFDEILAVADAKVKSLRAAGREAEATPIVEKLAEVRSRIAEASPQDAPFSVEAPAGSVIVFDPAGLHRGGVVRAGERLVVRAHCLQGKLARAVSSRNEFSVFAYRGYARLIDRVRHEQTFA
jgi:hypothetical protein